MRGQLGVQAAAAHRKLAARMAAEAYPLDYSTAMRVIRDALAAVLPAPVVVAEGANTMDNARCARLPARPARRGRRAFLCVRVSAGLLCVECQVRLLQTLQRHAGLEHPLALDHIPWCDRDPFWL